MQNILRTLATTGLLVSLVLAGCIGNDKAETKTTQSVSAPPPVAGEETGSVHGIVVDDSTMPIPGARAGLLELQKEATTDDRGEFTFNDVAPGKYRLAVQKLGYSEFLRTVEVEAGRVTQQTVQLTPMALPGATRSQLNITNGRIVCGTGNPAFTEVACGAVLDPTEANQRFLFEFTIEKDATGQLFEQAWRPTQVLSRDLRILIERENCDALCGEGDRFGSAQGCCYLRIPIPDEKMDLASAKIGSDGGVIQTRTFPARGTTSQPLNVFTDQAFTIYWEQFWGELPEDFMTTRTNVPPS